MAKVLGEGVNVVLPHPETQEPVTFLGGKTDADGNYVKGATLPDWADDLVGDHCVEGYVPAKPGVAYSSPEAKARAEARANPAGEGPPPLGGSGSGVDAWRAYATGLGLEVDEAASRDEIVQLVESGGYPTSRDA